MENREEEGSSGEGRSFKDLPLFNIRSTIENRGVRKEAGRGTEYLKGD